jgi:hypothetical protein
MTSHDCDIETEYRECIQIQLRLREHSQLRALSVRALPWILSLALAVSAVASSAERALTCDQLVANFKMSQPTG